MAVKNYIATVVANDLVADKTYRMRLGIDDPSGLDFAPGQFVNIQVADNARRSYSISSSPQNKEYVETYANSHPGGPGSKFFENAKVGQKVPLLGPLGRFVYQEQLRPVVFVATGTGITPFMSMIRFALEVLHSQRSIIVLSGFRFQMDAFGADIFADMQTKFPNLKYYMMLSKPDANWQGLKGRVTEHLDLITQSDTDVYLCGSQGMINDMESLLVTKGVPNGQIFYEQFY
jgi:NAD(P)H-flavin reductase